MKILIALSALLAAAAAQGLFGDLADFGADLTRPVTNGILNNPLTNIAQRIVPVPLLTNVQNFGEFLEQTGKTYASEADRALRETLFLGRKKAVDAQNALFAAGKSTYELGINIFADLPKPEILKKLTGLRKSAVGEKNKKLPQSTPIVLGSAPIPDEFDWRKLGGVSPVKFQGFECGACWSFAVTGSIEGQVFAKTKQLKVLSEQHLIDCSGEKYGNFGCDGGYQEYGFNYVIDNQGISVADKYPFIEKQNDQCLYDAAWKGAAITGYAKIDPLDEQKMKEVIAKKGPIACSVAGSEDSFVLYKSGIFTDEKCNASKEPDHAILVVGYGSENGMDYWIIKNSWTAKWGEKGFMRLPRGKNFCKIASECSYPIV